MQRPFKLLWLAGFCLALAAGCGAKNQPVQGKITVKGQPLAAGTVCFTSDKFTAKGEVKADGTYKLLFDGKEGAPPGSYKVFLVGTSKGDYRNPVEVIDTRYTTVEQTPLTAQVPGASSQYNFDVEPPL